MSFFAKTVAEKTTEGTRHSIEEDNVCANAHACESMHVLCGCVLTVYTVQVTFHAHARSDGLCGIVACDSE